MWVSKFISALSNPTQNFLSLPYFPPYPTASPSPSRVTPVFFQNLLSVFWIFHFSPTLCPHPHLVTRSCLFCWFNPFSSFLFMTAFVQVLTSCLNFWLPAELLGSSHTLFPLHCLHNCLAELLLFFFKFWNISGSHNSMVNNQVAV